MNLILFDGKERNDLLPLTFTRPVAELRMGILTFSERWKKLLNTKTSFLTEEYLSEKYPLIEQEYNIFINPAYFPTLEFILTLKNLKKGQSIYSGDEIIAAHASLDDFQNQNFTEKFQLEIQPIHIQYPWDLFSNNNYAITYDFDLITQDRKSQPISETVQVRGDKNKIFIEEGAVVEYCYLNSSDGVIYIGKNAEIMEGCMVRGSLALCEESKLNMGAKIYGGTTVGPHSKMGGELNNVIITGYSNKAHDGFLGNSVLGEWCNLGADSNCSNLKNNYAMVKAWNYPLKKFINTGLQFCGLIMGDHSKSAINTQFNTGTVVGVSSNIFTSGFPPNIIKSFSWGGNSQNVKYKFEKAIEVAEKAMQRRHIKLTDIDKNILKHILENGY